MITLLAPLGAKYKLHLVPEYGADGLTVTVAVIFTPKGDEDAVPKTLSFSGTLVEVEAAIINDLPQAVTKLVAHAATLEALDAQLKAEVEAKKKDTEETKKFQADRAKAKAEAAAAKKGKPLTSVATPAPARAPEMEKEEPKAPPPSAPTPAGLTPAWKKQPTESESLPSEPTAEDFAKLFPE